MKTLIHSLSARTIVTFLMIVLFGTACGSSPDDEVANDPIPSSTTSTTSVPEPAAPAPTTTGPTTTGPTTTEPPEDPDDEAAPSAVDVAAIREMLLNLEGFEESILPPEIPAAVFCDEPFFESVIPLAQPITGGGGIDFGIELLDFQSEADRDAHFRAVEDSEIACQATEGQTFQAQLIEAEPGDLLVYSKTFSDDSGNVEVELVFHVTKVGDTGMLTIRSDTLDNVNDVVDKLGLG